MKLSYLLTASFAFAASAASVSAETVLRYSNWLPATHPMISEVFEPWVAEVERVTEGRVKIETLPKVVGTVPTQFEVVRDGLVDLALIVDGYSAGRFKMNSIVELPFLGDDPYAITIAYWRIYNKYLAEFEEYENAVPFAKASVGAMNLASGPGPIDSIEKFEGLKIRVPNATSSKIVADLGGAPVNKPVSEMYELISTGVVDGMISSLETIKTFKVSDSIDNLLLVPGGLSGTGISFIVNEDSLAALSDEDREAFWSVSGEIVSGNIGIMYRWLNEEGGQSVVDAGGKITEAPEALVEELRTRLSGVDQVWIDQAKEAGLENAEEVLAEFRAEIATVASEAATQ